MKNDNEVQLSTFFHTEAQYQETAAQLQDIRRRCDVSPPGTPIFQAGLGDYANKLVHLATSTSHQNPLDIYNRPKEKMQPELIIPPDAMQIFLTTAGISPLPEKFLTLMPKELQGKNHFEILFNNCLQQIKLSKDSHDQKITQYELLEKVLTVNNKPEFSSQIKNAIKEINQAYIVKLNVLRKEVSDSFGALETRYKDGSATDQSWGRFTQSLDKLDKYVQELEKNVKRFDSAFIGSIKENIKEIQKVIQRAKEPTVFENIKLKVQTICQSIQSLFSLSKNKMTQQDFKKQLDTERQTSNRYSQFSIKDKKGVSSALDEIKDSSDRLKP